MKAKVESLTNQLTVMERKMNDVRRDLESQGNSMTDNSPIIKMKEATQQLKVEVKQLDVRIGLLVSEQLLRRQLAQLEKLVTKQIDRHYSLCLRILRRTMRL